MSANWMQTARIMRRMGFGATGPQIDAAAAASPTQIVTSALAATQADDDRRTPMPVFHPPTPVRRGADLDDRKKHQKALAAQQRALSRWWLQRLVLANDPVFERLTLVWHNHFATSAAKVTSASAMAAQNATLRTHCLGDFRDFALAMLVDPAMLIWLDGRQNTAAAPNENLAREFMELFALGHDGGYTEADVRAGARALTGWTLTGGGAARFVAKRHDTQSKTVLGRTGDLDLTGFCDAVLGHPSSASYVAGRLWRALASDRPASAKTLARLVDAYGSGRDLRALTTAIWTDPEFLTARATVVSGPIEWYVGALRAMRIVPAATGRSGTPHNLDTGDGYLRALGQRPFYPPDVGGWPSGQGWLSTAAATTRFAIATKVAAAGDVSTVASAARGSRVDAVGYLLGIGHWSDSSLGALEPLAGNPRMLVAAALVTPEYLTS
ncbi:DUF1800 domain-containing protein [Gordonia asplenii]|nr:DUF1800 domain-containing protein [Gordonia asplenii]